MVVALVSSVDRTHKTPEWEQVLTAGAVGQTMLIAASAYGYAAQWLTEWCAYDASVEELFGLVDDGVRHERIAGFIYMGSASAPPRERARPDLASLVTRLAADG